VVAPPHILLIDTLKICLSTIFMCFFAEAEGDALWELNRLFARKNSGKSLHKTARMSIPT